MGDEDDRDRDLERDPRLVAGKPGIGVDAGGGQVIDPTKNVEDLVEAKSKSDKDLRQAEQRFLDAQIINIQKFGEFAREASDKYQNFARDAGEKYSKAIVDAETRRIDQLAETRQEFQNTIRDMLAESVRTTSTLVSTQLVQIQATFDTRVSKLEAQAFTAAGRSSVADPAIEGAMSRMSQGIASLSTQTAESMNKMASINAEALAKLSATMASMQSIAAANAGEQLGTGQALSAARVAEALALQQKSVGAAGNQGMMTIIMAIIAGAGFLFGIFSFVMSRPAQVVGQPQVQRQSYYGALPRPTFDDAWVRVRQE